MRILVAAMLAGVVGLTTTSCNAQCNAECVQIFKNWAKAGGIGSVPAGGAAYCVDHPNAQFC